MGGSRAGTPAIGIGTGTALAAAAADLNGTWRSGLNFKQEEDGLKDKDSGVDGFRGQGTFRSTGVGSGAGSIKGSACSTPLSLRLQIDEERRRRLETEAKILRIK